MDLDDFMGRAFKFFKDDFNSTVNRNIKGIRDKMRYKVRSLSDEQLMHVAMNADNPLAQEVCEEEMKRRGLDF